MADYNEAITPQPPDPRVEAQAVIDFLVSLTEVRSVLLTRSLAGELDYLCLINRPIAPELRQKLSELAVFSHQGLNLPSQLHARLASTNTKVKLAFTQISHIKGLVSAYYDLETSTESLLEAHKVMYELRQAVSIHDKKDEYKILLQSFEVPLSEEAKKSRLGQLCEKFYPLEGSFARELAHAWERDNIPLSIEILYKFLTHFFLAVYTINDGFVPANKNWLDHAHKELTTLPQDTTALVHDLVLALGQLPDASKKAFNIVEKLSKSIIEIAESKGLLQKQGAGT